MSRIDCSMNLILSASFIHSHLDRFDASFYVGSESAIYDLPYDAGSLDVENGLHLAISVGTGMPEANSSIGVRGWLDAWMRLYHPSWLSAFAFGRAQVLRLVPEVTLQCFRDAELLETTPTEDVVRWWDSWAKLARSEIDSRKLEQGRRFERKSYELECEYLDKNGVDVKPLWMALDDNSTGFDIQSYRIQNGELREHFVEVKSAAYGNTFFLSRNEWDVAISLGSNYEVQFWNLELDGPYVLSLHCLGRSIPLDVGNGTWDVIKIGASDDC